MNTAKDIVVLSVNSVENLSASIKAGLVKKMIKEYPNYDPAGFYWLAGSLHYNGAIAKAPKAIVGKPEGMSDIDYINQIVSKNNKKFATEWKDIDGSTIEWKPLVLTNNDNEDIAEDFKERYLISETGIILQVDTDDCSSCVVKKPYFHKGMFHINLRNPYAKDSDEYKNYHRNQTVSNLVANVWGEDASNAIKAVEHQMKLNKAI